MKMKRKTKLTLAGLSLSLFLCAGCSTIGEQYADMIVANNPSEYANITYSGNSLETTLDDATIASVETIDDGKYGLLVVTDTSDNVGFYSIPYADYLVEPQFDDSQGQLDYEVTECSIGFVLKISYQESTETDDETTGSEHTNTYYYDTLGNCLFSSEYNDTTNAYDFSVFGREQESSSTAPELIEMDNGEDFNFITQESGDTDYVYVVCGTEHKYYYGTYSNEDGSITYTDTNPLVGDIESNYAIGDTYFDEGFIDLSDYGLSDGYYLYESSNDYYILRNNELICSFILPDTDAEAIFDGKIFYQYSTLLPEDSETYSYFVSRYNTSSLEYEVNKYSLSTCSVDLLSGETTTIDYGYLINSLQAFKNADGVYTYGLAEVNAISENLSISTVDETLVISSDGSTFYNASDKSFNSIVKLDDDHYFDEDKKVLYDGELNAISFFSGMSEISVDRAGELITGTINGFYGAMDYDLNIVIPFEYESPFTLYEDGCTISSRNDVYYRINITEGISSGEISEEEIGEINLRTIAAGCYFYVEENEDDPTTYDYTFVSSSKTLAPVTASSLIGASYITCELNDSSYAYAIFADEGEDDQESTYKTVAFWTTAFPNA